MAFISPDVSDSLVYMYTRSCDYQKTLVNERHTKLRNNQRLGKQ